MALAPSNAPSHLGRESSNASLYEDPRSEDALRAAAWTDCIRSKFALQVLQAVVDQRSEQKLEVKKEAERLIGTKADPNCRFKYKLGPKLFEGTPLTLAVKLDKPALVRKLIEIRADPQSEYSMEAGRSRVRWCGPAVCATVAKGNLAMMRLLVECDANLHGRLISFNGEPNVTLLYDASYFGHAHLVRYLLQQKGEPDLEVKFQDDLSIRRTALQISTICGHEEVVRVLLASNAAISSPPDDEDGPSELLTAIDGCHVEVLRLLVAGGADLFHANQRTGRRGVDHLFENNNAVLIAAAAKGLRGCKEEVVENITLTDFVRFLSTPDAEEIVSAVFRRCELRYWTGEKRVIWKAAYIMHGDMNAAVGPKKEQLEEKFQNEMQGAVTMQGSFMTTEKEKEQQEQQFWNKLLPHRFENLPDNSKIPVEISRALLPGLHRHPEVLWVLAAGHNDRIFDEKGARAIIELAWAEASTAHVVTFALDLIAALLFWALAFLLNDERTAEYQWIRVVVLVILMMIWARNVMLEVLQCIGFMAFGKLCRYLSSPGNLGDALRILTTGFSQIALAIDWDAFHRENQALRLIFAITGFWRWLRVLNTLKGFESTGKPMLPILQAIPATVPFFFVVFCWFSGFMHMYYSFGLTDWWSSGMIMYRLGFMADFARNELVSGIDVENKREQTSTEEVLDTRWQTWVDVLLVVMGLSMSIILMNILIGVLGESYNRGWEHRERLFLLERSRLVLQHFTTSRGWQRIGSLCRRERIQPLDHQRFVWFAYPKDPASWGELQSDPDTDAMNVHEKVTELRREIREMHEKMVKGHQDSHADGGEVSEIRREIGEIHKRMCRYQDDSRGDEDSLGRRLHALESSVGDLDAKIQRILEVMPR